MAIKIDCPRCKTPLQMPNDLAGGYVNCAQCKGRMWVPKDAPADDTPVENIMALSSVGVSAASDKPRQSLVNLPISGVSHSVATANSTSLAKRTSESPASTQTSASRKRVARFIAAEATDSTLQLAADGKLPELRLEEGAKEQKLEVGQRSINPLAMLGILSISVVMSIVLVLMDTETPSESGVGKKAQMRQKLEDNFFGSGMLDTKRLEPYQVLLREAQQAFSHGDYQTQRKHYRKVLDMLRAERGGADRGLTGSRSKDKELEEAISVLLSGE